jgi:hypothetical protein
VSNIVPLPLAPPPYRAEAIHSWLTRVSTPFSLNPRQLLHALHVKPFDGPTLTFPQSSLEAALDTHSRNHLARLARCDPSRLRCADNKCRPWMLANDAWAVFCPRCTLHDIRRGAVAYERTLWRLATRTVCTTHRCCLRISKNLPSTAEQCEWLNEPMTDLELAVIEELVRFERVVATAHRGSNRKLGDIILDSASFLTILRDLSTYCIESWDTPEIRRICGAERQVPRLDGYVTRLFNRERKHRAPRLGLGEHQGLIHAIDPAVRRVALWLTLQVIACPAPPPRLSAMRLGRAPQVKMALER